MIRYYHHIKESLKSFEMNLIFLNNIVLPEKNQKIIKIKKNQPQILNKPGTAQVGAISKAQK